MLTTNDLDGGIADYSESFEFRLETIGPADKPEAALLSGHDQTVLLKTQRAVRPPSEVPANEPTFVHTQPDPQWNAGRAGMQYRDLVPSRYGGRYIASHIRIAEGGPVPDYVHYHHIRFQLIFVHAGWVDVVYEDQGQPFRMVAGDAVLQPPHIRHRVLESSAGLEVVELGCPAQHDTHRDHNINLPTATLAADRDFGGQRFVRHIADDAAWDSTGSGKFQDFQLGQATNGLAEGRRRVITDSTAIGHKRELLFWFVRQGTANLIGPESGSISLAAGHAIAFAPLVDYDLAEPSADFEVLEVEVGD